MMQNQEFTDLCAEAVKANADYQGGYALGCPLGRVMISKLAVQFAAEFGCEVVAHGCTGKGNDQVRFESYITTLNPDLKIIAPVREWSMGRNEQIEYALTMEYRWIRPRKAPIHMMKICGPTPAKAARLKILN